MSGEVLSNCCGEPAGESYDIRICPSCKEHCDWLVECDECEGKGFTSETCTACNGSGEGPADGTRCQACKGKGGVHEQCSKCDGSGEMEEE